MLQTGGTLAKVLLGDPCAFLTRSVADQDFCAPRAVQCTGIGHVCLRGVGGIRDRAEFVYFIGAFWKPLTVAHAMPPNRCGACPPGRPAATSRGDLTPRHDPKLTPARHAGHWSMTWRTEDPSAHG